MANYNSFVLKVKKHPKWDDHQVSSDMGIHLLQVIAWRARLAAERSHS